MGNTPTDPAAVLRARRHQAGLTQEQLANAAGVHVRTIRGLESGRIRSPRRSSIQLIATALGLGDLEARAFSAGWGSNRVKFSFAEPVFDREGTPKHQFDAIARETTEAVRLSSLHEVARIDSQRRLAWRRTEEVIEALQNRVTQRPVFFEPEDRTVDLSRLHLSALENCRVVAECVSDSYDVKVFTLELDAELRQSQQLLLGYTAEFTPAYHAHSHVSAELAPARLVTGFFTPPQTFLLTVRFHPAMIPVSCHQVFQRRPGARVERLAELGLTASNAAHLTLANPQAGGHGIEWDWNA